MKKRILSIFLSFLLLSGCQKGVNSSRKERLPYDENYPSVCEIGKIDVHDYDFSMKKKNLLPPGYSGEYKSSGIYEFGGYHGEESGRKCPPMDFCITKEITCVLFYVTFQENPYDFPSNSILRKLGYEFSYLDKNGDDHIVTHLKEASRYSELFSENHLGFRRDDSTSRFSHYIYEPKNAIVLSVHLYPKEKVNFLRFLYQDSPQPITNAGVSLSTDDLDEILESRYEGGNDCSRNDYTEKLGSDSVIHLVSPYGTCYSKNYFLSSFIVKDEKDNIQEHVSDIQDLNDYFHKGKNAKIGEEFTLVLSKTNSLGNTGKLTIQLVVGDKTAPIIQKKGSEDILSSSYKKTKEEFVKENFFVQDNYDQNPTVKIVDKDGNPLERNQIGKKEVTLVATDCFQNIRKYDFILERYDDVKPEITTLQDEVVLTTKKVMTSENLLSLFSCFDEIDGKLTPTVIKNTYSEHCHEVGEYVMEVSCTDKSGNETKKSIRVLVQEEDKPVFYTKENFLTFVEGNIPDENEIIQSLIRNEILPDKNYIESEYVSGDEITKNMKAGDYTSTMCFYADDDSSETVELEIKVKEKENFGLQEESDVLLEKQDLSFFEKIAKFFKELWEKILDFLIFWD